MPFVSSIDRDLVSYADILKLLISCTCLITPIPKEIEWNLKLPEADRNVALVFAIICLINDRNSVN